MKTQITFEGNGRGRGLLQDVGWNFNQRRAAFGNERRHQLRARAIGQIKRPTVGVENAGRSFDNQSM